MSKRRRKKQSDYIWSRPGSPYLWFSRAVPERLQKSEGKKAIQFSLKTSDPAEARMLARLHANELDVRWGLVPSRQLPTPEGSARVKLTELAVEVGYELLLENMDDWRRRWPSDNDGYIERLEKRRNELRVLMRRFHDNELNVWERIADRALDKRGLHIEKASDVYNGFVKDLAQATIDAVGVFNRRNEGELDAGPRSVVVQDARSAAKGKAKPGEAILDLFERYANQLLTAKKKRPAGIDQDRMVISQFADFVGRDRAVAAIGYEQAKEFVDALEKLPAGYKKKSAYRGLSIRQAIEKGQHIGDKPLKVVTQQRYISTLSPFFAWLKSEKGGRRIEQNPFDGLHKDTANLKRANARPPFTAEHITRLIGSPLFTGFLADGKEHLPGNKHADDWRFWIPMVCLFTGARIGEVAQLHVDDVYRDQGVWCVELRHDEKAGQLTKSGKSRSVALHSTLLEIGILEFVERQKQRSQEDGNSQLFPELKPGTRGQYGDQPSAWWRDYLSAIELKAGEGDGFGSHSFRHTLADQLRASGHLDQVFGPLILGHSAKSVTGGYGESRQGTPKLSQEMIDSVKFVPITRGKVVPDGKPVDFSHLINVRAGLNVASA